MKNVNDIKEREIASYSIRTDAGRLFFDLKWGDRENYLQITQSKKVGENDFHREKIVLSKSELLSFKDGILKAIGFLDAMENKLNPFSSESSKPQYANGYKSWEDADDEKLLSLFQEGKSMKEIGTILGRSRGAVKSRFVKIMQERGGELPIEEDNTNDIIRKQLEIMNTGKEWTKEEDDKLREMLLADKSQREIALELGRSESSIYYRTLKFVNELELTPDRIKEQYKSALNRV